MRGSALTLLSTELVAGVSAASPQQLTFEVPREVSGLTVELRLEGGDARSRVDVMLVEPAGFRGSGMTRSGRLDLRANSATPSPGVLAGPITHGTWTLILLWVNPEPGITTQVTVVAERDGSAAAASATSATVKPAALDPRPGWRKGDLHVHSLHSTGTEGVAELLRAAEREGLDFISVTDHNTISGWADYPAAQASSDQVLLIRGQEVTASWGHVNVHGGTGWADIRSAYSDFSAFASELRASGALLSVNHPFSNDVGWRRHDTDWRQIDLLEVQNSLEFAHNRMQLDLWDRVLATGADVVGVAATDAKSTSGPMYGFGRLVTWVNCRELSEAGVLGGLRSGRVVVSAGPRVDFWAENGRSERYEMGERATPGEPIDLTVQVEDLAAPAVVFLLKSGLFFGAQVIRHDETVRFSDVPSAEGFGVPFYRAEVHHLSDQAPNGYDRRHRSWDTFLAATNPIWVDNSSEPRYAERSAERSEGEKL